MPSAVQGGSGLRVAMLAPISWRVPPRHYGLWEQFVSLLTEGSSGEGSMSPCSRPPTRERGSSGGLCTDGILGGPGIGGEGGSKRADEFDLIHNNFDFLPLTYSRLVDTPVLTTIHGFSSEQIVPVFKSAIALAITWRSANRTGTRARLSRDDSPWRRDG